MTDKIFSRTKKYSADRPDPQQHSKPSAMIESPWLSAEQAAEYLAYPSRKALYEATRRGLIPVHRLGRRLLYNRNELDRLPQKIGAGPHGIDLSWG